MAWVIDKKEQKILEDVKRKRPWCKAIFHTFIEYHSENKKTCHDCGYTETLVIKE
jgi:hypothetical protein